MWRFKSSKKPNENRTMEFNWNKWRKKMKPLINLAGLLQYTCVWADSVTQHFGHKNNHFIIGCFSCFTCFSWPKLCNKTIFQWSIWHKFTWRLWTSTVITCMMIFKWNELRFLFGSFYLSMHCKKWKWTDLVREVKYDFRANWIWFHGGPSILNRSKKKKSWASMVLRNYSGNPRIIEYLSFSPNFRLYSIESFHWKWQRNLDLRLKLNFFRIHLMLINCVKIIFENFNEFCTLAVSFSLLLKVISFSTFCIQHRP